MLIQLFTLTKTENAEWLNEYIVWEIGLNIPPLPSATASKVTIQFSEFSDTGDLDHLDFTVFSIRVIKCKN